MDVPVPTLEHDYHPEGGVQGSDSSQNPATQPGDLSAHSVDIRCEDTIGVLS